MSGLSGYDSEAVGFDSITINKRNETDSSTQTSETGDCGSGTQTTFYKDCGSSTCPEDFPSEGEGKEYPPPGLNAFLRRVVPTMIEQIEQNDREMLYNSSDSEEEEVLTAKLCQEIKLTDLPGSGGGDEFHCILDLCWSSAGNSLAVSFGKNQHESWCTDDGLVRIFSTKRTVGDDLVKNFDLTEKSCISVVKYHPSISALIAYGTHSGEVVLCNLQEMDAVLTCHDSFHNSKRVTGLQWADAALANIFLTMHIINTGKRRSASDHILISSGTDGSINVWQVNANAKTFENVISYFINGSRKMPGLDISCFDFVKTYPLRPSEDKVADDVFVVGTNTGALFLCKAKTFQPIADSKSVDPMYEVLDGHRSCVLSIMFSSEKPGIFVSTSIDSELRVYNINQTSPLKVICIDVPISSAVSLPNNPWAVAVGVAKPEGQLRVYHVGSPKPIPIEGLVGGGSVTALAVNHSGVCRIAAADTYNTIRVWELPARRLKLVDDIDF